MQSRRTRLIELLESLAIEKMGKWFILLPIFRNIDIELLTIIITKLKVFRLPLVPSN